MTFKNLPVLHNAAGELRRVGFELEFANLGIEETVAIIQKLYGGQVVRENKFLQHVNNTRLGDFTVEFDLTLLTQKTYKQFFEKFSIYLEEIRVGAGTLEEKLEEVLEGVVGKIFPYEIAAPPLPCTQLADLEALRQALYEHHAAGTESFPTNAFGTHINVELPDTQARTIHRYLQAFLVLYPWLLEVGKTDLARRLSPFIDPFPPEYVDLVLAPGYAPDLDRLIGDYHLYNPDRNRPLDLYPLFAALDDKLMERFPEVGKVKPRTTFHYRLPNSSISLPDWTLACEWNNWVVVEELVHDPDRLAAMGAAYVNLKAETILGFEGKWVKQTSSWLS